MRRELDPPRGAPLDELHSITQLQLIEVIADVHLGTPTLRAVGLAHLHRVHHQAAGHLLRIGISIRLPIGEDMPDDHQQLAANHLETVKGLCKKCQIVSGCVRLGLKL